MGRRKFTPEERDRIAAFEAHALEEARQESVRARQKALDIVIASIDKTLGKTDPPVKKS